MDYISTKDAAQKWNISQRRIVQLASAGRIEGATRLAGNWVIPQNAQKPADGRAKEPLSPAPFRFPLYLNTPESAFTPPLSQEERTLRQAQLAFNAGRLDDAQKLVEPLSKNARNRYVRIAALHHSCLAASLSGDIDGFKHTLSAFKRAFSDDFPHKTEMELLQYDLDLLYGHYHALLESFRIDPQYPYHPDAYNTLAVLSLATLQNDEPSLLSRVRLDTYEMLCLRMEHEGCFFQAQTMHFLLVVRYQMQANAARALFHLRQGFELALEHDLLIQAAIYAFYFPELFDEALAGFPEEFACTVKQLGARLHASYLKINGKSERSSYLGLLSNKEFVFVTLAMQGYSNKQVARHLGISESSVSKKYGDIYAKLQVANKRDLVRLVHADHADGSFFMA